MDSHTLDIAPAFVPDEAPHREAGIPRLDHSEPGPYTELGRAQRMAEVARNIPKARLLLAGLARLGALGVAVGAFFLLRPRKIEAVV